MYISFYFSIIAYWFNIHELCSKMYFCSKSADSQFLGQPFTRHINVFRTNTIQEGPNKQLKFELIWALGWPCLETSRPNIGSVARFYDPMEHTDWYHPVTIRFIKQVNHFNNNTISTGCDPYLNQQLKRVVYFKRNICQTTFSFKQKLQSSKLAYG